MIETIMSTIEKMIMRTGADEEIVVVNLSIVTMNQSIANTKVISAVPT
jgi:hypothetical protein